MMAAQEIIELFCELISVRLPIIETQRLFLALHYLACTMFISPGLLIHFPFGFLSYVWRLLQLVTGN
jgi:hypothetical protein